MNQHTHKMRFITVFQLTLTFLTLGKLLKSSSEKVIQGLTSTIFIFIMRKVM